MTTIYDIARAIGVSQTTVANALKGRGNVSDAMRQRILDYAQEVGYRPNVLAQSLTQRKTYTIGFILPTIANPFYPEIAEEIEHLVAQQDYQVLLCNTRGDAQLGRKHLERLQGRWVDGIIVMGISMDVADIQVHFNQGLPTVLCDWQENESPEGIPQASIDFYQAGALAAHHLLEIGHRKLAIIVHEPLQIHRLEGFRSTLAEAGISLPAEWIQQGDSTLESGYEAARRLLLSQQHRPTAIFATNDWMAIGAMGAARDLGLRIPQDLSVIGLDDIVVGEHYQPALTTIAIPKQELARAATELLLQQIARADQITPLVLVQPSLLVRQSTAAPSTSMSTNV
ncbi:LacI family DNA-binding transcriptional regulator [Tengunoibacter tsumagoiensis]|uniref:LacI family transcriptional regulator n=1 Tax=Tengunoibacter tsumagoiensis TaxID=2014871 RepID=A0A401ZZC1_9CHLR|nr:LacI family DNA-binding transcriptional regulator [Tengunoibacter tsumagoiensis]GCE12171.1 LacI family transcriptional regulator [Tengunoibacter tsumagoiensis]